MSRNTELIKNTSILTIGKICTQCLSFFLLPLYTAVLDTSEYGIFDLLMTYAALFLPLVNWQFEQGIFRFVIDERNNQDKICDIYSCCLSVNVMQVFLYAIIIIVIDVFHPFSFALFLFIYVSEQVFVALHLQLSRGLGNNKVYAFASFISASVTILLNILFLICFDMGLEGLLASSVFAQVVTLLYLTSSLKSYRYFKFKRIDIHLFKQISQYTLPLIPNNLSWWVINVSDRTIISFLLGTAANGIYSVANKFSDGFINFFNVFNLSWTETVLTHINDKDRDTYLSNTMSQIVNIFACICLLVISMMPFIFPILISRNYSDAYIHIAILMYAMLFRIVVGMYSSIYIALKDTKKVAATSISAAIINFLINIVFIRYIGLYAASLSTLIAFLVMAIVRYFDVNKYVNMKISSRTIIAVGLLSIFVFVSYIYDKFISNVVVLAVIILYSILSNKSILSFVYSAIMKCKKGV